MARLLIIYRYIVNEIGQILGLVDDDTTVFIVSEACPHSDDQHVTLSGTKVYQMLQAGEIPREFSCTEVAKVLIEAMRQPVA